MRALSSFQARLALWLGVTLSLLWLTAAGFTALSLRQEMEEVFDSALQETAQRLLPLAVLDIINRDDDASPQLLAPIRDHGEFFTYVVRDAAGTLLMQSHAADPALFPPTDAVGFRETPTHRVYTEHTLQGSIRLTVAEPLAHRQAVARDIVLRQALPLLLVIPLTLVAVVVLVRAGFAGVRKFRTALAGRGERDLSPVPVAGLPSELVPVAETINALLARLHAAFEAERGFAANAAHELRTPLAGAIAQAQRLRQETADASAASRAAAIEDTLKRLTLTAERLMQLARAEGGRLRLDAAADLRPFVRMVADDLVRTAPPGRLHLTLPETPVLSDLDPDVFAILCRNLIDNALRHGASDAPVTVALEAGGVLRVENDGPVIAPDTLSRLTDRFARAGGSGGGSGLGLAIVAAIVERAGATLTLHSPRPGLPGGFTACVQLPDPADYIRRNTAP